MKMGNYKIIKLPISKKINDLTEKEAKKFNEWFIKIIPDRLKILNDYVKEDDKKLASKLDLSPESLVPLGKWFANKISTRKRTKEEMEYEKSTLYKFPNVEPEDWTFTEETFSLFFDMGMYLGSVFTKKFKSVKWFYVTKPKSYIDRNWSLLAGFKLEWCPIRAVNGFASKLLYKECDYTYLKYIYDYKITKLKDEN